MLEDPASSTAALEPGRVMAAALLLVLPVSAAAATSGDAPPARGVTQILETLPVRALGPYRAGSWITDVAVPETPAREHLYTFYVAARNGGLWKTTNRGTTFENVTDSVGVAGIGDVAVAPSDGDVVWIGTGDAESARSSYAGTGVYRSLDGGATWEHRGLADSHHVARIAIHPREPSTVWVAALGHLFSESAERGVFKTTDGGATWSHVLDLGPRIGVVDLVLDPSEPDTLYASAYEKERLPWHFEAGGPGSGIYRSRDGGETWSRLENGLPRGDLGRIGVDLARSSPRTLYAVVENLALREPTEQEADRDREAGNEPEQRIVGNQIYRSDDGGDTWRLVSPPDRSIGSKAAYSFNEVRVDPGDPERVFVTSETLISSVDGGRTWRDARWPPKELFSEIFGDVRTLWIDPFDSQRMILGSDGGVFVSLDGGRTADHLYNLPLGEVYAVTVDTTFPYHVYAGLQDHEAWRAPVNSWSGAVTLEDWAIVGLWDGMYVQVDPSNRWVYSTTQFGNPRRVDLRTGRRARIEPEPPEGGEYRYTWTTPLQMSPHDPDVLYLGAQVLLRSPDRGDSWEAISPDLTTADQEKIAGEGHVNYCTITTLEESMLERGEIWVGTDDGRVHLTRDGGETWIERTEALTAAGAPVDRWVSRVRPSRHRSEVAYVSKSGYRRDDPGPYLYRTEDGGETWASIAHGLPEAPISVVLEDPHAPEVLYVGNDLGVWVSLSGGESWTRFPGLPTVPVRDLAFQERERDLVIGTYGRGLFVVDVWPLREIAGEAEPGRIRLLEIEPKPVSWSQREDWGDDRLFGDRHLKTPNEPAGLGIYYLVPASRAGVPEFEGARSPLVLRVERSGQEVAQLGLSAEPGLHRVHWEPDREHAEPGEVVVLLEVDHETQRRRAKLLPTPDHPLAP